MVHGNKLGIKGVRSGSAESRVPSLDPPQAQRTQVKTKVQLQVKYNRTGHSGVAGASPQPPPSTLEARPCTHASRSVRPDACEMCKALSKEYDPHPCCSSTPQRTGKSCPKCCRARARRASALRCARPPTVPCYAPALKMKCSVLSECQCTAVPCGHPQSATILKAPRRV